MIYLAAEKKQNLSDKRIQTDFHGWCYGEWNIKEAVKRLKEERGNCYECGCSLTDEKIMEIFGDKLVEKGK